MRRIVTAISAAALAFSMVSMAMPANAAAGFDSAYAGESAFLTLNPGQAGTFTVFFANTGTTAWTKGTATQVDLAACLEDKVTCNQQDAGEAPFNPPSPNSWLSATRYTTHTQTTVAPGAIGTFTYNVQVPSTATGLHRFNGATVVSTTGADVHNEGYYQDVNIPGQQASCNPTAITTTPVNAQETVGATHTQKATVTCSGGTPSANAAVTFAVQAPTNSLNSNLTLTAVTDASGNASVTWTRSNPDTDSVSVFPTAQPNIRATATIFWVTTPVLSCSPTTSQTNLNNNGRIFTVTLKNPKTGVVANGFEISIGVQAAVTKGTATITTTESGTRNADLGTNADANPGIQLAHQTTDANGNVTFTVSGANSTITPMIWVEDKNTFGGDGENTANDATGAGTANVPKADTSEFQAVCGTTTFAAVNAVTLTVSPTTAATQSRGAQRAFTVSAADASGNPTSATVTIGFVENLLSTTTTSAIVVWYDIDQAAADQRGSASTSASRNTVCGRVPPGTWDATTNVENNPFGSTASSANYPGATVNKVTFTLPAIGRATFGVCSDGASDTFTPLAFQDTEAVADRLPQTGEPQAQGGATTTQAAVMSSGLLTGGFLGATAETNPATGSAGDTATAGQANTLGCNLNGQTATNCFGQDRFTFQIRNQSRNAFFSTNAETVQWTVQNTGSSTVFIVDFDGSTTPTASTTVAVGQTSSFTVQIPANPSTCQTGQPTVSAALTTPPTALACVNQVRITVNSGDAGSAKITAQVVSNANANASATKTWVVATAQPATPNGVSFTATGTVIGFRESSTAGRFYLLQTSAGTIYKINYTGHDSDTYIYLGTQLAPDSFGNTARDLFEFYLATGVKITFTDDPTASANPTSPTQGNAIHNITATQ
jgi:hypothetical protein